jgi:hypothetical protein
MTSKIEAIKSQVAINAPRVKELGNWPSHVDEMSLVHRIPDERENRITAPGFDAGIACCLDLIPRDKQRLSAILHGAYTPEAIKQIQKEIAEIQAKFVEVPNETAWWLAACSFCKEGDMYADDVINQINSFKDLAESPWDLINEAKFEFKKMEKSYHVVDGIPVALKDGGMQAAYIHGYSLAIMPAYGTWFVGTYHASLGIPDDFVWGTKKDDKDRPMSGPVFGSKQFVKCATIDELNNVLMYAKQVKQV